MNILITTAGRRTYIIDYFKEALDGKGKVIAANSIYTYTLSHADEYVLTPSFYANEYIPTILSICKSKAINAVISLLDADAKVLSEHHAAFGEIGTRLIIPSPEIMDICNDKWLTYQFLMSIGLSQPKSYIDEAEVKNALISGKLTYPILIKPRWGIGSFGIYIVENEQEIDVLSQKLRHDIMHTYMGHESEKDVEGCVLYQEIVKGQEYGVQVLNDLEGSYAATFALKKLAMRTGETDIAETVDTAKFGTIARSIADNLHHIGMLDMDCMLTSDGSIVVLELNCRFGGQYPFVHLANVNVPKQIVRWLEGNNTCAELITQTDGIKSCKELTPVVL